MYRGKLRSVPSKGRHSSGMQGRDRKGCDHLGAVEVPFLSPRSQGDAHAPWRRLTLTALKRA
jgi:hypothetical protein